MTAPHVLSRLSPFGYGSADPIPDFARALSPAQLRGDTLLPLHLQPVSADAAAEIPALHPAERRLLLVAALNVTDRTSVALSAADVGTDIVLGERVRRWIAVADGRYRFLDPRLPAALVGQSARGEKQSVHASLARAMRGSEVPFAVWHEAQARDGDARLAAPLTQLAERCAATGLMEAATHIAARAAALALDPAVQSRAHRVAARASFWDGRMADAAAWARRDHALSWSNSLVQLVAQLEEGPVPDPVPIRNAAQLLHDIRPWVITAADRDTIDGMLAVIHTFLIDRDQADEMLARLLLGARPAAAPWPWSMHQADALSPFAEAHLRGLTAAFQARAGAFSEAVRTLREAGTRLPLGLPGGGVVPSLLRAAVGAGVHVPASLVTSWSRVGPRNPVIWNDHGALPQTRASLAQSLPDTARRGPVLIEPLSPREAQVAAAVLEGRTNRAVGTALGISDRTVEVHLRQIFRKYGVSTRAELIASALGHPVGGGVPSSQ